MNLHQVISNAQHIPNIPKVVQELIQSFGNEKISGSDIAATLNKDQAMTAKVLRIANSSQYAGNRNVGSINDAVVLLGFNALRTMVLASGLASSLPTPEGFDIRSFWVKSFSIGSLGKWVAKYTPDVDPEIAFTCGMLHDIGGLLIHILVHEEALAIDASVASGADRVEMEEYRLGFNFTEAGAKLADRWHFPENIVEGIRHQLDPADESGNHQTLAGIIYIAKYLYENNAEDKEAIINNFPKAHVNALNINLGDLTNDLGELEELLNDDMGALLD